MWKRLERKPWVKPFPVLYPNDETESGEELGWFNSTFCKLFTAGSNSEIPREHNTGMPLIRRLLFS